jgi:Leu/Phe-tRNA-protein transferase
MKISNTFKSKLSMLQLGTSYVYYQGKKYITTKHSYSDDKIIKIYAKELGGNDIVSGNYFTTIKDGLLKPCEMSDEKVIDFVENYTKQNQLYLITHNDIKNQNILNNFIYKNMDISYYVSDNFAENFYIDLALAGFISVWNKNDDMEYLLPEIQFEYAILDFKNLHISKKVQKLLNQNHKYRFIINENLSTILKKLDRYHDESWINGKYKQLIINLDKQQYKTSKFKLQYFAIEDTNTKEIVAGEIGYTTNNSIYTSLSGFSSKEKIYNNYGTLQLVLTAKYLEQNNYKFWNLGHPYMQYKIDLGATILSRDKFLKKFLDK